MTSPVHDDALLTSLVPYGDFDVVVRMFSRAHGRIGAFARGARKSRKRFAGLVAPAFARVVVKPRSGELWELTEIDVDARLLGLGGDLRAYGFAGYVVELVERVVPEGASQPALFDLVEQTLVTIGAVGARPAVLRAFELLLLHDLGVLPDIGDVVDEPGQPCEAWDPVAGQLLAHPTPASVPFPEDARKLAHRLVQVGPARAALVDDPTLRPVGRIFASWLRRQGGAPLRSIAFLRSLDDGNATRLADGDPAS